MHLLVSVVGQEKQDFINKLTLNTRKLGGKWLVNRLGHLDGQIAGLFKLEIDEQQVAAFKQMMASFTSIQTFYHEVGLTEDHHINEVQLKLEAEDRSGLTTEITQLLLQQDVEVHSFQSQRYPVIELGTSVFEAHLDVSLPESLNVEQLKTELESIGENLRVSLV